MKKIEQETKIEYYKRKRDNHYRIYREIRMQARELKRQENKSWEKAMKCEDKIEELEKESVSDEN